MLYVLIYIMLLENRYYENNWVWYNVELLFIFKIKYIFFIICM